jgi:hypothetical protein
MRLHFVRARPLPLPSEPLRSAVIQLTRNRLAADRREGRRGCGSARSIASGSGSAAEAGSAAKLAVTGGALRTGDVTAGGENRN